MTQLVCFFLQNRSSLERRGEKQKKKQKKMFAKLCVFVWTICVNVLHVLVCAYMRLHVCTFV